MKHTRKNESGFSLLELLIVVSIMLIIAAIAIPSFLHAQRSAQETAMASTLRSLFTSARQYENTFPNGLSAAAPADFSAVTLANLGNGGTAGACNDSPTPTPTTACIVDDSVSSGVKGPYTITQTKPFSQDGQVFEFTAAPPTGSPLKSYRVSQSGVILVSTDGGTTWASL